MTDERADEPLRTLAYVEAPEGTGLPNRWLVLALISAVGSLNFADRQLLPILIEPIKAELHLSDTIAGALMGPLFAIAYTGCALPIAWLADRSNRMRVLAIACAVWSLFTVVTALCNRFWSIAAMRIGVSAGEAGATPTTHGIIAEYFPPTQRGVPMALFAMAGILGASMGAALGASIAASYNWRMAFVALGAPGLFLSAFLLLVARKSPAASSVRSGGGVSILASILSYFRYPVLRYATIGGGLIGTVVYGLFTWAPAFLMREKGMTLQEVSRYYAGALLVSMTIGLLIGGIAANGLGKRPRGHFLLWPGAGALLATPLLIFAVQADGWVLSLVAFSLVNALIVICTPVATTLVQNTIPPEHRSVASAILVLGMTVLGLALGPFLIGYLSDNFGGLKSGMLAMTPFCVLAGLSFFLAWRSRMVSPRESGAASGRA